MLLLSIILTVNIICTVMLGIHLVAQNHEIYDLRARILEIEIKEINKKPAKLYSIK